eukprot:6421401-Prymnesium_polylepis.1
MGRKKTSRGIVALDAADNKIEVGTAVVVNEGQHNGKNGTVKHIFKAYIFIHSQEIKDNTGVVCVRSR